MKIFTKFDYNAVGKKVLEEKLDQLGAKYRVVAFGDRKSTRLNSSH